MSSQEMRIYRCVVCKARFPVGQAELLDGFAVGASSAVPTLFWLPGSFQVLLASSFAKCLVQTCAHSSSPHLLLL